MIYLSYFFFQAYKLVSKYFLLQLLSWKWEVCLGLLYDSLKNFSVEKVEICYIHVNPDLSFINYHIYPDNFFAKYVYFCFTYILSLLFSVFKRFRISLHSPHRNKEVNLLKEKLETT